MGLLERAASATAGPKSGPTPPVQGLLQRSLGLIRSQPPGPAAKPEPETLEERPGAETADEVTDRLLGEARRLPLRIELPARLFSLLVDRLRIAKGALLLFDSVRQVYAPWAWIGYDPTTHRRLRIAPGAVEALGAAAEGQPAVASGAAGLAAFQQFFSTREYAAIERILIVPLAASGKLAGFLLVTEAEPPFSPEDLPGCLTRVAAAVAPAIREMRERAVRIPAVAAPPAQPEAELEHQIAAASAAGARFQVFSVSLEGWEQRLLASLPYLDPFRLEEDLRSVLYAFVAGIGAMVSLGGAKFLAAIRGVAPQDLPIFSHQLAALLESLFGEIEVGPSDIALGPARAFPPER